MSHETFKVGEVCILRWSSTWPQYPQSECTVTGMLRPFRRSHWPDGSFDWKGFFSLQYEVQDEAGEIWVCSPSMLRKKRPPQDWVKLCNLTDIPREVCYAD